MAASNPSTSLSPTNKTGEGAEAHGGGVCTVSSPPWKSSSPKKNIPCLAKLCFASHRHAAPRLASLRTISQEKYWRLALDPPCTLGWNTITTTLLGCCHEVISHRAPHGPTACHSRLPPTVERTTPSQPSPTPYRLPPPIPSHPTHGSSRQILRANTAPRGFAITLSRAQTREACLPIKIYDSQTDRSRHGTRVRRNACLAGAPADIFALQSCRCSSDVQGMCFVFVLLLPHTGGALSLKNHVCHIASREQKKGRLAL